MKVITVSNDTQFAPLMPSYTTEYPIMIGKLAWINPNQYLYSMSFSKKGSIEPDTPYAMIIQQADTYVAAKALAKFRLLKTDMQLNAHDQRLVNDLIEEYKGKVGTRRDWSHVGTPLALFANMQKIEQNRAIKTMIRRPFEDHELTYYDVPGYGDSNVMGKMLTAFGYTFVYGDCNNMPIELKEAINLFVPETGTYTWRRNDGSRQTVEFTKGVKNGSEKLFWGNGNPYRETNWKKGKKDGVEKIYTKNGALKSETLWSNGEPVVTKTELHPDGTVKSTTQMTLSGRNGEAREFYPDGKLWSMVTYKDNKRNGLTETYYENGYPRVRSEWKDDEKHGTYRMWDRKNNLVEHTIWKKGKANPVQIPLDSPGMCGDCGKESPTGRLRCEECEADMRQVIEVVANNPLVTKSASRLEKDRLSSHPVWEKVSKPNPRYTEEDKVVIMEELFGAGIATSSDDDE